MKQPELRALNILARPSGGFGDVNYSFVDRDLTVSYEYFDELAKLDKIGRLIFSFVLDLRIESGNNNGVKLPKESGVLYSMDTDIREDFTKYQVWFSNNDLITMVCDQVSFIAPE